jgi:hypothetical protein
MLSRRSPRRIRLSTRKKSEVQRGLAAMTDEPMDNSFDA